MTPQEKKRADSLSKEIDRLKTQLIDPRKFKSNSDISEKLEQIGNLLSEKNELTGLQEDMQYLFYDDGEWYRRVVGFLGDDSGTTDFAGTPLKIGDTVSLKGYPRIVMVDLPTQATINEYQALKIKDYSEMDIHDAFCVAFTVSLHSCLDDYENSISHETEMIL